MTQILSFINKDQHFPSSMGLIYEHFLETLVQRDFVVLHFRQLKLPGEETEQVISLALRLKNKRGARGIAILREELKQQRRLSHSRPAEKDGETQVRFDGLNHRLQRGPMHSRGEKECRVWRNAKRCLTKPKVPEKFFVLLPGSQGGW